MNVFSKFFFDECTRFLFILVAFWSFNNDCFAKENNPSKKIKSEIEMIIPKSNDAKQDNSKKLTKDSSPKDVKPETEQGQDSEKNSENAIVKFLKSFFGPKLTEDSSHKNIKPETKQGQNSEKNSENAIVKFLKSFFGPKLTEDSSSKDVRPETEQEQDSEKSSEDAIAEFMKSFSGVQNPFKDYPGYWNQLPNFDLEITCIETNDEFPSKSFSLKDLKGNVVIVFFTTTWCHNCEKVFQDLDKLAGELSGKNISNVKIITLVLGTEDDNAVKNYYKTNKVKSLRKFRSISPEFFKEVNAVPTCFIFDKKSVPVWGFSGAANYGNPYFLNFIEDLSKEDVK